MMKRTTVSFSQPTEFSRLSQVLKKLGRWALTFFIIGYGSVSFAQTIAIISNASNTYQANAAKQLTQHLTDKNVRLTHIEPQEINAQLLNYKLVISLDLNASKRLFDENIANKVIHALITRSQAQKFAPCLPHCQDRRSHHHFLLLDQPYDRQLRLIKKIMPRAKTVSVLVSQNNPALSQSIEKLASRQTDMTIKQFETNAEFVRYQIDDIAKTSDIILAIADTDIYNRQSLSPILLTSYQYKTPVLGFSKGFINAGAISGVTSSLEQVTQHLSEHAQLYTSNSFTSSISYPRYFTVISNRQVAKSLNLFFDSDRELTEQLLSDENP